jgi:hypothetical protein
VVGMAGLAMAPSLLVMVRVVRSSSYVEYSTS